MLKDKVIVITGGAGLIGIEFAKTIIENRGFPIIADISYDLLKIVQIEFENNFGVNKVDCLNLDISSKKSLSDCIEYIHKKYKKIDALVNSAYPRNKNYGRHFFDVEYSDFLENLGLNLGGYFLASQQFGKYFKNQGYGNIINIGSIYGVISPRFEVYDGTNMTMPIEYAAIKSGLIHLTKYMAKYFKGMNIRVNALSPGGIFNNQPKEFIDKYNDLCLNKGMLDSSDLTGTLIYLLSDMSRYVNGQNIIIDDGFTL